MEALQSALLPGQEHYLHDIMQRLRTESVAQNSEIHRTIRQAAGQLHQYSAMMVEAARLTSSLVAAIEGKPEILTQNATAVIHSEQNHPQLPRLLPGMMGMQRQIRGVVV
eukprot:TRINITY_DN12155_c0_g2_i1.p1 TRINITY_DN12155_c0_g2~~TRINITY_DN12155_c0_g2_i1.p1  ORF type:complete len:110 (-),score=14.48 TRINITY_DN12155_c0_g2_i1:140-469(-)